MEQVKRKCDVLKQIYLGDVGGNEKAIKSISEK
jgi:hypothetical protein